MPKISKTPKTQEELLMDLRKVKEKQEKLTAKQQKLAKKKAKLLQKIYDANEILPRINALARNIFKDMGLELDSDVIRFVEGDITAVTGKTALFGEDKYLKADTPIKRLISIRGIGDKIANDIIAIVEEVKNKHSKTE